LLRLQHQAAAVRRLRLTLHWQSVGLELVIIATTPIMKAVIAPSLAASVAQTSTELASIIGLASRRPSASIARESVMSRAIALHRVASVAHPSTRAGTTSMTICMWARLSRRQMLRHLQTQRHPRKLLLLLNLPPRRALRAAVPQLMQAVGVRVPPVGARRAALSVTSHCTNSYAGERRCLV